MTTKLKRIAIISLWTVLPKAAKGAIYRAHRARVVGLTSQGRLYIE